MGAFWAKGSFWFWLEGFCGFWGRFFLFWETFSFFGGKLEMVLKGFRTFGCSWALTFGKLGVRVLVFVVINGGTYLLFRDVGFMGIDSVSFLGVLF